ncbi:MAG: type II/IV secretion system ATPase subunit [Candidatus Micrarchaeota archaeon]|nr:type II/IV secretion system ATPase subunit [Candidatus Micrarchaeota archaeon]
MASLGWKLGDWKAEYLLPLKKLSAEECEIVSACAKRIADKSRLEEINSKQSALEAAKRAVASECDEQGFEVDSEQVEYLSHFVFLQTYGLGFLDCLLSDQTLEEIAMVGIDKPVYVYKRGVGWKKTNAALVSQDYFVSLVNRLGRGLGRRLTSQQPRINAVLEDGARLHASMPPISDCELTIRMFGKHTLSVFDLLSYGTYSAHMLALLSLSMQADLPVLFAGNTASGKTTALNAMLCFLPASERLLLIEETPEISVPHPHQIRLVPFVESGIGMVELVRDSLRMRPDRVVVGEIRSSEEAKAYAESALSGQAKGSYATFHAQSARDAMLRMRMMGCLEPDLEGIGMFVVQRRVSVYNSAGRRISEARKVTEIAVADRNDAMRPVAAYDGKALLQKGVVKLEEKICSGTGMTVKEVRAEAVKREKFFLSEGKKRRAGFEADFAVIQKFLFGGVK